MFPLAMELSRLLLLLSRAVAAARVPLVAATAIRLAATTQAVMMLQTTTVTVECSSNLPTPLEVAVAETVDVLAVEAVVSQEDMAAVGILVAATAMVR